MGFKLKRKSFSTVVIFSLVALFLSCNNMLTTPIKDERDFKTGRTAADYLSFTIPETDYGTTEPAGELSLRVGGTYDLVFTENSSYQFIKWEVVNTVTGKLTSEFIKIADATSTETQMTILKSGEGIELKPICAARPKVLSQLPQAKPNGVFCDSVIVVTFDKEISESSIYYSSADLLNLEYDNLLKTEDGKVYGYINNDNIHFKNIEITSDTEQNLLEYFNAPVLENGTVLKLFPKTDKPLLTTEGSLMLIDVMISPEFKDADGYSVGGDGIQWRYRINSNTDKEPPVFNSFTLATTAAKAQSSFAGDKLIAGNTFNALNHVQNKLYFTCSGADNGSINYLELKTKYIQTPSGIAVTEDEKVQIITDFTKGSFELQSNDGLIQLTFTLFDMSGNASDSVQSYIVAKDTEVSVAGISLFNNPGIDITSSYTSKDLNTAATNISWKNSQDDVWQKDNKTASADLKYTLFMSYDSNKLGSEIPCTKADNYKDGLWTVALPEINPEKDTFLTLKVEDALGNVNTVKGILPSAPAYFTYQKISDAGEYSYTDEATGKEKTIPYPAHYRIFYSNNLPEGSAETAAMPGYLYYTTEDSEELKTQSFINLSTDWTKKTAQIVPLNYTDLYVNDISKCKFYFQTAYRLDNEAKPADTITFASAFANLNYELSSGALLKSVDSYLPELRNVYLMLNKQDKQTQANNLIGNYYLWKYLNNKDSSFYKVELVGGVSEFAITESQTLSAPEVHSITVTKGGVNSGVNNVSVRYASSAPYGVVYNFLWGKSEAEIEKYETSDTFTIESGITKIYYKTVAVDSANHESKTSSVFVYDLSENNYDTKAPQINNLKWNGDNRQYDSFTASEYYPVVTAEICYDNYQTTNGYANYVLYVVPADHADMTFGELSEDRIKVSPSVTGRFIPPLTKEDSVTVWNNIEGLGSADHYFYVLYLEDLAGNYSYTPITLAKYVLAEVPDVTVTPKDSNTVTLNFAIEKEINCNRYQFQYYKFDENLGNFDFAPRAIDGMLNGQTVTASTTLDANSYYFAFAKAIFQNGQKTKVEYTKPVYFYTGSGSAINCELKDLMDGKNGAQIYCDRPCLVMTYWSSENYGYSISDWETFGVQCNPMFISAQNNVTNNFEDTLKYYTVDYSQIPRGKFYVVVIHFADGTALMSKSINTN